MADLLLGIDVGTQGVKAALLDPAGRILTSAYKGHDSYYPSPGWVEQDMTQNWWLDPIAVIRNVTESAGERVKQIRSIGISGLYPALGPTDRSGNPLSGAILYSDNRSVAEVEEVNRARNLRLSTEELTPKLVWFLRHEPELAGQLRMFFDAAHYLIYKLTGAYVTDTITAGLYGAIFEAPSAEWRQEACDQFGIPFDILPQVYTPAQIVGLVHREAAAATGLAEGIPVTAGMPDLYASMISAGVVYTHEAIAYYGTAGVLPVMKDSALNAAWKPFPIAERGGKIQEGYLYDYPVYSLSVGDGLRWFREQFALLEMEAEKRGQAANAYALLDRLAARVPAGSEGLIHLPYFQGQRSPEFNPYASGVFFGLKNTHTRAHFFRALLESWGYSIRHGLDCTYPGGHPIQRLVATGGGARSPLWRQIVSDITGLRQEWVKEADGPLGAAYLAGLAVGLFEDFIPLQNNWVQVSAITEPDLEAHKVYDRFFPIFIELHSALKSVNEHLHSAQNSMGA